MINMENLKTGSVVCFLNVMNKKTEKIVKTHKIGNHVYNEKTPLSITTAEKITGMIRGIENGEYLVEIGKYDSKSGFESSNVTARYSIYYLRHARILC